MLNGPGCVSLSLFLAKTHGTVTVIIACVFLFIFMDDNKNASDTTYVTDWSSGFSWPRSSSLKLMDFLIQLMTFRSKLINDRAPMVLQHYLLIYPCTYVLYIWKTNACPSSNTSRYRIVTFILQKTIPRKEKEITSRENTIFFLSIFFDPFMRNTKSTSFSVFRTYYHSIVIHRYSLCKI